MKNLFKIINCGYQLNKGFTLVEVVTAVGIFTLVITVVVGIAVSASRAQREAAVIQNIQDNLRFALEFMSREMRTGTNFNQIDQIGKGDVSFKNQSGEDVVYQLSGQKIQRLVNGGNFSDFIAGGVLVENLKFYLSGQGVGDGNQTLVVIAARLKSSDNFGGSSDVQISVTPRALDK